MRYCEYCKVFLRGAEVEDGQFCCYCGSFAAVAAGSKCEAEAVAFAATLYTHTGFFTVDVPERKGGWLILDADTVAKALPEIERKLDASIIEKHAGAAYEIKLVLQS